MKKGESGILRRIAKWVRIRLVEGYEALIVYRWARVILGFFAFIGRKIYSIAGSIPDFFSKLGKLDLDKEAGGRLDAVEHTFFYTLRRIGARIYGCYDSAYQKHRMAIKMALTTALLILSMVLLLLYTNRYTALMCAGMGFSWLADAMLMEYPPVRRGVRQYFLWGMGGFACAMALYAHTFIELFASRQSGQGNFVFISICVVFGVAALLIWICCIAFNQKQMLILRLGTLGYGVFVSLMAASACAVAIATAGRVWWLVLGGVFFFISDMLIALFNFGSVRVKHPDGWIWAFYAPAQLLLLTGACAAAAIG